MNSQAVEVAIGLVLTFFVVAVIASGIVELGATIFKKRANDLENTIKAMLGSQDLVNELKTTSVYRALQAGSAAGKNPQNAKPSYISARAFADSIIEMLAKKKGPIVAGANEVQGFLSSIRGGPIGDRLNAIEAEVQGDVTAAKAQLEAWFDDAMERLQGAYTRWARWLLLGVGLALACSLNISATSLTSKLWTDPVVRQAVVASANSTAADQTSSNTPKSLGDIETSITKINSLKIPIGWGSPKPDSSGAWLIVIIGWIITGFTAMLGAPFWFDLLKRLTGMGGAGTGSKPATATNDTQSASFAVNNLKADSHAQVTVQAAPPGSEWINVIPNLATRTAPKADPTEEKGP